VDGVYENYHLLTLELYIRNRFYISTEITLPEKEDWMNLKNAEDFEIYCSEREEYVRLMIRGLLNKYARAIENQPWEIRGIIESKINQEIVEALEKLN
jgi:hypothetical protein